MRGTWLAAAMGLTVAGTAAALPPLNKEALRKTTSTDLAPPFERLVLANGLTVLLSPEPTASAVVVQQSFAAGTTFEPPGKSGLAHLVEHLMATGRRGATDFKTLLDSRGATGFNAVTTLDVMTFQVTVPAEELPLALWVAAERLTALPSTIDAAELERNRRIVLRERAENIEDVAWGNAEAALFKSLFPAPHPLHGMVIGVPAELATVTVEEARAFATRYLAPANGTLTLVQAVRLPLPGDVRLPRCSRGLHTRCPSARNQAAILARVRKPALFFLFVNADRAGPGLEAHSSYTCGTCNSGWAGICHPAAHDGG